MGIMQKTKRKMELLQLNNILLLPQKERKALRIKLSYLSIFTKPVGTTNSSLSTHTTNSVIINSQILLISFNHNV